jgi:hypothetical protein
MPGTAPRRHAGGLGVLRETFLRRLTGESRVLEPATKAAGRSDGHNQPWQTVDPSGSGCSTLVILLGTTILGGFDESLGPEACDRASLAGTSWQ